MVDNTFLQENGFNQKLTSPNVSNESLRIQLTMTIEDIRKLAILKYGSIAGFSRKMQITRPLGSRLLSGKYIPLKKESIQKIADILEISPITLTRIYDSLKEKKVEVKNGNQ